MNDLVTVQTAIGRVQGRRLGQTMPKHNKWRDGIELGMPADPRRQQFVGVGGDTPGGGTEASRMHGIVDKGLWSPRIDRLPYYAEPVRLR
ncbi:hypothetical protein [Sinorhizobium meliloti]|uniref:hypothetical protein n=1 Tax=Rhizobium meliloti TaxID=382 RepID=UPI001F2BACE4|nr:hypothetical protein [Sinorhizobium meliloti]